MTDNQKRVICATFFAVFLTALMSGCAKFTLNNSSKQIDISPSFASFRDVPGVTEDEISAVENLQKRIERFVYGATPSTEAFITENGEIGGYAALLCEWLTALFSINFQPQIIELGDVPAKLKSGEIDFSSLIAADERLESFYMTGNIAERALVIFRIENSLPIDKIILKRDTVRYVFLEDDITLKTAVPALLPGTYEIILVKDYESAYKLMKSEEADAFIEYNMAKAAFDAYGDVAMEDFLPLIFGPVSMVTGNSELAPIISVVSKALKSGAIRHVNALYNEGNENYKKDKFIRNLNAEEKEYLRKTSVVPVLAVPWFYPLVYYNKYEKKWEGIGFDTLDEVTKITGLVFEVANPQDASWAEVFQMLNDRKAPICLDLIRDTERNNLYLWSKYIYMSENYALVSKNDFPNINIGEIQSAKIGLIKSSSWSNMFLNWFPEASHAVMYASQDDAFLALYRGDVELVMAGTSALSSVTNYYEFSNYKANYIFNSTIDYVIAYNLGEELLWSVIDKALAHVDIKMISKRWENKTYDFQARLMREQRPWLIGAICLSLGMVVLILVFYYKTSLMKKQLEIILNNVESGIAIIDAETRVIMDINPVVARMYGGPREKITGQRCDAVFSGEEGCPILDKGQTMNQVEKQFINAQGEVIPIVKSVSRIKYNGRQALLESFSDITELKKAEEAKSASEAKSRFIANMSHEMRTPLNAITGMTAIGKNAKEMERKDYALDKIETASVHLLGVINDVLDMSKIEANMLELSPCEFNFEKMLQKVVAVINFRVGEKRQMLVVRIDGEIPKTLIADDQRLAQVVTNLLSNAVKFAPEGSSITLKANLKEEENGVCTIQIAVSDEGIGISGEQLKRLFSPFQQAESSTTRKYGGSGLGLAISKSIIEMMGGTIWVESEPGKGSTFAFTIQAARGAEDHQKHLSDADLNNVRIMAVDDDHDTLTYFLDIARRFGVACDTAASGEEALEFIAQKGDYHIYFIDWKMPGVDSLQLARAIKERKHENSLVIMISAAEWSAVAEEAREAGVDKFLSKPLFPSAITDAINEYVGVDKQQSVKAQTADITGIFAGRRILLVEDVEINREIVQTLLEPTRLEIDCAENGIVAVRKFTEAPSRYEMIFMDVQMPEMDGYEATRRIRAIEAEGKAARRVPIIAMTANVFKEDIAKCLDAGMDSHVGKPLDFDEVLDHLHSYLGKKAELFI